MLTSVQQQQREAERVWREMNTGHIRFRPATIGQDRGRFPGRGQNEMPCSRVSQATLPCLRA